MGNIIRERLAALRALMTEKGIDAYLVPTDDFHSSEYVGDYFKCRKYIIGFTGSAGTAVVMKDMAGLWTDGRYFIQAEQQLAGSTVTLFKMGVPDVPTVHEFLEKNLAEGQCLGFDGRTVGAKEADELAEKLSTKKVSIVCDVDLVGEIWTDRPALSCQPVSELDVKWAGKSRADKLADVRKVMKEKEADVFLLTCLDDIAWLLNIRGGDIECNPVVLSYLAMTQQEVLLFANEKAFSDAVRKALEADGVTLRPYDDVYAYAAGLDCESVFGKIKEGSICETETGSKNKSDDTAAGNFSGKVSEGTEGSEDKTGRNPGDCCVHAKNPQSKYPAGSVKAENPTGRSLSVLLCRKKVNSRLVSSIPKNVRVIDEENPTLLPKAIKNPVEVENERIAHIKDGVAVTKFIYWLKKNVGKIPMTELSAADYLNGLRAQQEHFMGNSFEPIISVGPHAAINHYSATPETDVPIEPEGLLLADTGGQYLEGTTDITRTIVLGPVTEEQKKYFTAVLRGMLNLAGAKFLYGCCGLNLDYLARGPLWELGQNFNHGTGHGVGYYLNVHEGPNGFRWKIVPERNDSAVLEEGMITSDEPGYYVAGAYGIRHENLIVCKKAEKTDFGQFMCFETLTMVPFDLDGIVPEQMTGREREMLNAYHAQVYEKISPYLEEEERAWLQEATRAI